MNKRVENNDGQIEFISVRTGERRVVDVTFRFPSGVSPEWTADGRALIVVGQARGEKALKLSLALCWFLRPPSNNPGGRPTYGQAAGQRTTETVGEHGIDDRLRS